MNAVIAALNRHFKPAVIPDGQIDTSSFEESAYIEIAASRQEIKLRKHVRSLLANQAITGKSKGMKKLAVVGTRIGGKAGVYRPLLTQVHAFPGKTYSPEFDQYFAFHVHSLDKSAHPSFRDTQRSPVISRMRNHLQEYLMHRLHKGKIEYPNPHHSERITKVQRAGKAIHVHTRRGSGESRKYCIDIIHHARGREFSPK